MKPLRNKGEAALIMTMGIGLVMLVVLGYIMFPVITGIQNSTPVVDNGNSSIAGARGNYTNSVAGAITLFGVSPIVYAAVIVLVILLLLAKK